MNRFQASVTRLEVTIQVIIPHPAFNQQIIIQLFKCSGFNFSDFKNLFPFLHFDKTTTTTMYLTNTYTRTLSPPIADKLKNPLYQLIPTHTFWQSHYVQHKHTLLDSLSNILSSIHGFSLSFTVSYNISVSLSQSKHCLSI